MADFELPGDSDMIEKVQGRPGQGRQVGQRPLLIEKQLAALEAEARKQVMAE